MTEYGYGFDRDAIAFKLLPKKVERKPDLNNPGHN